MRGLSTAERVELAALCVEGERAFDDAVLDALEEAGRAERFGVLGDGSYRMRATELGLIALRLP